ncbi:MAG: DNA cytosine methyltransferase [Planctomycetaceae bacterium]|jgi:DNA (cytosine-5)-methyltransferase 1|nr:DNA cytosine methyltransferase [Planctomycetaceae bacterium]
MNYNNHRVIDLFSGIGGLSLGLQLAGFDVILAIDNWQPAIEIYEKNFKHPVISLDLSDVVSSVRLLKKYSPDIIVGGPPCQDYSSAGKRDEEGGRANLTISFAEIVNNIKPLYFIMENVDMIVKSKRYKQALDIFRDSEYGLTTKTLDASFCGVPQKRKRHFVVGALKQNDNFMLDSITRKVADKPMTIRDYLGEILEIEYYYRHPRNYSRRAVFSIDEPSPTVRGVNRPIPDGYKSRKNDANMNLKLVRPLTTKERSFIQTFPPEFNLIGSKTNIEQAIGNAVPVNLGKFIGECLKDFILHGYEKEQYPKLLFM